MKVINKILFNRRSNIQLVFIMLPILAGLSGCKKYLDAKPDSKLFIPTKVEELQALLDNSSYMNVSSSDAGEIASDNYYVNDNIFTALADRTRNAYLWKGDIFIGASPTDWAKEYNIVYYANVVLENLGQIEKNSINEQNWNNCRGSALVYRAKAFFEIAQIWAKAYDSSDATFDLGIPLRLTSDFNKPTTRPTLQATYDQIINDLKSSISLLPNTPAFIYRPSKPAAYGLLARTYLATGDYNNASLYADSALQIKNTLLDFNSLNAGASNPFSSIQYSNPEHIMYSTCSGANSTILRSSRATVDSLLYNSYQTNDLRRTIFYKKNGDGSAFFRGSYDGGLNIQYNGITTAEMYLIRAEGLARNGDVASSMSDLNSLLKKRWSNLVTYPILTAIDAQDALKKVLDERRKELVFRMLRLSDIKRLNRKGANITLKRIIQGQTFTLPPNDSRFALPIPTDVIQITGVQQN